MSHQREGPEYDVEISASMVADELTFGEVPKVRTRTWGDPRHEGTSGSEREGVSRPARAGKTYAEVFVDYRLASRLRSGQTSPDPQEEHEEAE